MMAVPRTVSVAIATYNRAPMVRQAVEAALAQSLPPAEVVISDDASTDDTRKLFIKWMTEFPAVAARIQYIRQKKNSKGVINWNRAMEATKGDFIAWCSDDDRFLPGHLDASVKYLELHPEAGLVHSGFVDLLESGGVSERAPRPLRSNEPLLVHRGNLIRYLFRYYDWPFHPSTIVMRRAVWERIGPFDPRYALADTDWFVRAAMEFPVALLPRHGVLNRRHSGNWSNQVGSARMQCEIYEIVDRAIRRIWPHSPLRQAVARCLWSGNVRVRLALTIRARVRSGHTAAARVAWQALACGVGRAFPKWLEKWGQSVIERWPYREPTPLRPSGGLRETVSPP
jgi:glycosyltransferase involved in cell wall biosynthesis